MTTSCNARAGAYHYLLPHMQAYVYAEARYIYVAVNLPCTQIVVESRSNSGSSYVVIRSRNELITFYLLIAGISRAQQVSNLSRETLSLY
uniref:Uncharacterized protein n=1 Tax=Trichogramma kaykai TaxID=54128 RepID=A0ABD2VX69_9HYME